MPMGTLSARVEGGTDYQDSVVHDTAEIVEKENAARAAHDNRGALAEAADSLRAARATYQKPDRVAKRAQELLEEATTALRH